jgi:hypothetical protein
LANPTALAGLKHEEPHVRRLRRDAHGAVVIKAMRDADLRIIERGYNTGEVRGLVQALSDIGNADVSSRLPTSIRAAPHALPRLGRRALQLLLERVVEQLVSVHPERPEQLSASSRRA